MKGAANAVDLTAESQGFLSALAASPFQFDFHLVMRKLEALFRDKPRFGEAVRPSDEAVRLGQPPELSFAASALTGFSPPADSQPGRLDVAFFGLFGPHGPLPLHITEFVRDRVRNLGDRTFAAFADLFHHRMLVLFHRAWAQAQPTACQDRPQQNRFDVYVGSLLGIGMPALSERSAIPDRVMFQYAGWFANSVRNPEGLARILAEYFEVPVSIDEFQGEWLDLSDESRMRLGGSPDESTLGRTTVLGRRVYRADHKFRVRLGPLDVPDFLRLLPGNSSLARLSALVRAYAGEELAWDLCLRLEPDADTQICLGGQHRLGFNASLGRGGKLADVIIDPVSFRTLRTLP
jgi:type VI secretion system protein ImpH